MSRGIAEQRAASLVGVYLHGSLAMGGFNPAHSDLDLLAVTQRALSDEERTGLARLLLEASNRPYPLEVSILARQDVQPWRYPTPYQLHYSEAWRGRFEAWHDGGALAPWLAQAAPDPDLAAHITIARARGVTLLGAPAAAVFPAVPARDYLASILLDIEDAPSAIVRDPVYVALNLCRVCRYLRDGGISSKDEGGVWATRVLPPELAAVAGRALAVYRGERADAGWDTAALARFAAEMAARIAELLSYDVGEAAVPSTGPHPPAPSPW